MIDSLQPRENLVTDYWMFDVVGAKACCYSISHNVCGHGGAHLESGEHASIDARYRPGTMMAAEHRIGLSSSTHVHSRYRGLATPAVGAPSAESYLVVANTFSMHSKWLTRTLLGLHHS
jgi:hypothetical protein